MSIYCSCWFFYLSFSEEEKTICEPTEKDPLLGGFEKNP